MGRERAIRSPVSAGILLLLLRDGPLSSVQLSARLGLPTSAILGYLHYFKRTGLVAKNSFLWTLTERGVEYTRKYARHMEEILESNAIRIKLHKLTETSLKLPKDIADEINRHHDLRDCDCIVEHLVKARLATGRRWWLPPPPGAWEALGEECGVSSDTARLCVVELQSRGILYARFDSRLGTWKLRLDRRFDTLFANA